MRCSYLRNDERVGGIVLNKILLTWAGTIFLNAVENIASGEFE